MLEHYRKTFWGMQVVITLIALAMWAYSHVFAVGLMFWVVMQASSLVGASWAKRLRNKMDPYGLSGH